MTRVKALELLENTEYCVRLTMESYHRLLLQAGCEPDKAQKLASEHGMERLGAGLIL
jgi:hypothetical protein